MNSIRGLKQRFGKLKQDAALLPVALLDRRTPISAKLLAAITLGYLLSPIDLIPDFIPVLGLLDDLLIVPLLLSLTFKLIPAAVLEDIRQSGKAKAKLKKKWYFALPLVLFYLLLGYWGYSWYSR